MSPVSFKAGEPLRAIQQAQVAPTRREMREADKIVDEDEAHRHDPQTFSSIPPKKISKPAITEEGTTVAHGVHGHDE